MHLDTKPFPTSPCSTGAGLQLGRNECLALSQLAALHGHVVSYREFTQLARSLNEIALCGVTPAGQLAVLWSARFPQGRISATAWPPNPTDVPALWIGPATAMGQTQVMVVLGAMANGGLSSVDENGRSRELPATTARLGRLLVMEPGLPSPAQRPPLRLRPGLISAALLTLLRRN